MSARRVSRRIALSLLLLPAVGMGLGCGNDLPPNGASVDLVDPAKAKQQGQSTADYYKAHPEAIQRGSGRR